MLHSRCGNAACMSKAGEEAPSVADRDMDGCVGDTSGLVVAKAALPQHGAGPRVQMHMPTQGQIHLHMADWKLIKIFTLPVLKHV